MGGFVFLLLGNFTYNELIEWKIWGLNKDMSKYKVPTSSIKKDENLLTIAKTNSSKATSDWAGDN